MKETAGDLRFQAACRLAASGKLAEAKVVAGIQDKSKEERLNAEKAQLSNIASNVYARRKEVREVKAKAKSRSAR